MTSNVGDILASLPNDDEPTPNASADDALRALMADLADRSVPTGRLTRMWSLGTTQATIAVGYAAHWLRSAFVSSDVRQQKKNEQHLNAAIKLLGTMGYLRGAVMKFGQILSNYPSVVPQEFADVLGRLHFQAPPMHFALLREMMRNELGAEPEELFENFEKQAFAAASLGQVHRARLKGRDTTVAIKVQYPNIASTIRNDVRNLKTLISPMRLSGDWDNLVDQLDDIEHMLQRETDYVHEAGFMRSAREAFTSDEGIVVPRPVDDLCTSRVLTMEYIDGVHLPEFLARSPSQAERDRAGELICRALFRLCYHKLLLYADPHPGNFLFMPDGRLGLIDFGCCHWYSEQDKDYLMDVERAMQAGPEELDRALIRGSMMTPKQQNEHKRLELLRAWTHWLWEPMAYEGAFDFGDETYFQRGMEGFGEILKRRYIRSLPLNNWLGKQFFGLRAMLTHLKARVEYRRIWQEETIVQP